MTAHQHHIRDDCGWWHCFTHPYAPSPRDLFRYLNCAPYQHVRGLKAEEEKK